MTEPEIISALNLWALIASIGSVLLACIAIALSVVFYRMANSITESTREAANKIGSGVEQMKNLMDTLYRDTFSLYRDTHSALLDHAWTERPGEPSALPEEIAKKTNEQIKRISEEFSVNLEEMFQRQRNTDTELESVRSELKDLVEKTIDEVRSVEILTTDLLKIAVVDILNGASKGFATAGQIWDTLQLEQKMNIGSVERYFSILADLKNEGKIMWSTVTTNEIIPPTTKVELIASE